MKTKLITLIVLLTLLLGVCLPAFAACKSADEDNDTTGKTGENSGTSSQTDDPGSGETPAEVKEEAGFTVTFVTDEQITVTVYPTQDDMLEVSNGEETAVAYSRDGDSGKLLSDGTGQINFLLSIAEGYELEKITISGDYNNLKGAADTGYENGYRITKIASDLTVTITAKAAGEEEDLSQGYKITFAAGEHVSVTAYKTQDMSGAGSKNASAAYSRDSSTGALTLTDGQVNFILVFDEGYECGEITIEGSYKALKGPSDTGYANGYRITKIASDLTVTVTAQESEGGEDPTENPTEEPTEQVFTSSYDGNDYSLTVTPVSGNYTAAVNAGTGVLEITANETVEIRLTGGYAGGIQFTLDESHDLQIDLYGVELIATGSTPAICITEAANADISVKSGTTNVVTDLRESVDEWKAAIYSTCDLKLKGSGSLTVYSANNNGIHTKDDLKLLNLTLTVNCLDNALKGNDSVTITSGTLTLIARQGDGIKTSNSTVKYEDDGVTVKKVQGTITITGGTICIYAACDGIDAAYSGGIVDLATSGGDTDTLDSNGNVTVSGGVLILKNGQSSATSMTGGTIDLDGKLTVSGGILISVGTWCNEASLSTQKTDTSTTLSSGTYTLTDGSGATLASFTLTFSAKGYRIYIYGKSGTCSFYRGTTLISSF